MAALELSEDQVLAFRARRGHLLGPGAESLAEAARSLVGAQAQQEKPALHALSLRTAARPTAEAVKTALLEERSLVRTWGQRDTVHIYDPETWPLIVAAWDEWSGGGRRGGMPTKEWEDAALVALRAMGRPVNRADMEVAVPPEYLATLDEVAAGARMDPAKFGAGRLLWRLAHRGEVLAAHKKGATQFYADRLAWFPELEFGRLEAHAAAVELTRRYLAVYGPATVQDIAHNFNAKVSTARSWVAELSLAKVACGGRKGLLALTEDECELRKEAPDPWLRLLPLYDTMLMAHKDKSWTVPVASEEKAIWRKAAYVAATVVASGRFAATWTAKATKKKVTITLVPLSGWNASMLPAVQAEADALACHWGVGEAVVVIA